MTTFYNFYLFEAPTELFKAECPFCGQIVKGEHCPNFGDGKPFSLNYGCDGAEPIITHESTILPPDLDVIVNGDTFTQCKKYKGRPIPTPTTLSLSGTPTELSLQEVLNSTPFSLDTKIVVRRVVYEKYGDTPFLVYDKMSKVPLNQFGVKEDTTVVHRGCILLDYEIDNIYKDPESFVFLRLNLESEKDAAIASQLLPKKTFSKCLNAPKTLSDVLTKLAIAHDKDLHFPDLLPLLTEVRDGDVDAVNVLPIADEDKARVLKGVKELITHYETVYEVSMPTQL